MTQETISFLIHGLPTILFLLIIVLSALSGLIRGLRKSVILWIHSLALFIILIIVFVSISGGTKTDQNTFNLVNTICKGNLRGMLGVSDGCNSFTDSFIEIIPKNMDNKEAFELVLRENGAYLQTLASLATRLVIALILWIVYFIGIFVLYIIYQIFYPVRRHIRKLEEEYNANPQEETPSEEIAEENSEEAIEENSEEKSLPKEEVQEERPPFHYNKKRLFGALVGAARGFIAAFIFISFIGSFFYIVAGGDGSTKMEEMDWGDENTNLAYNAYSEIESYGTSGIFKVMNVIKDKDNAPFYLFAADLVFKGDLDTTTIDNEQLKENVILRKELASYTGFAKDTFNLIIKYGAEDIRKCINKEIPDQEMMDVIVNVMAKEEFKTEFLKMVADFKASTYFVNLSYSLVTSIVNHMDGLGLDESLGATSSLLQILFRKGYFAEEIPYEKYLKDEGSTEELAYFKPSIILNQDDAVTLCSLVLDILPDTRTNDDDTYKVLNIASKALKYINDLTILSSTHQDNTDAVLARVYQFIQNSYFKKKQETELTAYVKLGAVENPYTASKFAQVSWVTEIKSLISATGSILDLYKENYVKDQEVLDNILGIFDTSDMAKYNANMELYKNVEEKVGQSFLLGDILAGEYGSELLTSGLKSIVPDLKLTNMQYSNTKDSAGNEVKGEFYYLLDALKAFASNEKNRKFIKDASQGSISTDNAYQLIKDLSDGLTAKDPSGASVIDCVLSSRLFTLIFSEFMISADLGDFSIYVDDSLLVESGVHEIKKDEIKTFFTSIGTLVDDLMDIGSDADTATLLDKIISEDTLDCLKSKIIEGTLSSILVKNLDGNTTVVIPQGLVDKSAYISTTTKKSEVYELVNLCKISSLKLSNIVGGSGNDQMNSIIGMFKGLSEDDFNAMMQSNILYYTMSKYMLDNANGFLGNADLIIPAVAKVGLPEETNISVSVVKSDLVSLFSNMCGVLPADMSNVDLNTLITDVLTDTSVCDSVIFNATITNLMLSGDIATTLNGTLIFPESYTYYKDAKIDEFTASCAPAVENPKFLTGIDVLIGDALKGGLKLTENADTLQTEVFKSFNSLNETAPGNTKTNLEIVYASDVMALSISKRLDDAELIEDTTEVHAEVKTNQVYHVEEVESLITFVNMLDLDLSGSNIYDDAISMTKLTSLRSDAGDGQTKLEHLYDHKIVPLIITKALKNIPSQKIPSDAYLDSANVKQLYVAYLEADTMIATIDTLNLDMNTFEVEDDINPSLIKDCLYDSTGNVKSKILLTTVSDTLLSFDTIQIPYSQVDPELYELTEHRLNADAVYDLFLALEALGITELDANVSQTALPTDSSDIEAVANSVIVDATLTKNLNIKVSSVTQPMNVIDNDTIVLHEKDSTNTNDLLVLTENEIKALILAINKLTTGGSVQSVSIDLGTLKTMSNEDRNIVLSSNVICPVVSDIILGISHSAVCSVTPTCYDCKVGGAIPTSNVIALSDYTKTAGKNLLTKALIQAYLA